MAINFETLLLPSNNVKRTECKKNIFEDRNWERRGIDFAWKIEIHA